MFHPQGPTLYELAVQALSSTDRGYDLLAPKFDYTPFRTPDPLLEVAAQVIGENGPVPSILDVCCGTGAAVHHLRSVATDKIVGIDRSEGMLAEAARRSADAPGTAAVAFDRGDARDMPYSAEFDVAVCFGAFGHIEPKDEPAFVRSIHRALKPGGRFVFITSRMPPVYSVRYLASRGFNAAMRVRNALIRPPFIMYYLTFMWPDVGDLLRANGFDVEVREGLLPKPFQRGLVVVATRRE